MDVVDFFSEKRPWSKYKDLILEYYLEPYLSKVAKLEKPIVIVDCFAGPGKFKDGKLGSPLIISKRLSHLHEQGIDVRGFYIESNPDLYKQLEENMSVSGAPSTTRFGNFQDYVTEIANLAKNHTVFVYLDPIKPSDLLFNDLQIVYDKLHIGQSVETLINFMSTGFLRGIWGSKDYAIVNEVLQKEHPQVQFWDQIAGGIYWQSIAFDQSISQSKRTDQLANGYANKLRQWFKWVLTYPIREKYKHEFPKYHLIFGSRSHHAVDLMNRAMVKARREFVGAFYVKEMLFENQPEKEVVKPEQIRQAILETSNKIGKTSWTMLRINATIKHPCMYTDSEFNTAIKKAIQEGRLGSTCRGDKIKNNADVWPLS